MADTTICHSVKLAGLSFQWDPLPATNPSFATTPYTSPDALAVSVPNYLRACFVSVPPASPSTPLRVGTTSGTFTLLSLYAANGNPQLSDGTFSDSVTFTGLLRGVPVPACGASSFTLPNGGANGNQPCAATQVTFSGCENIDTLQIAASTANPSTFYCIALDSIVVQACSADSSISAAVTYSGTGCQS